MDSDNMRQGTWLTRKELFDLVWSTPMIKLAERFGISDVALSKKCRKLDIPRPGLGYWARIAAGQKAKLPVLPPARAGQPESVYFPFIERTVIVFSPEIVSELETLERTSVVIADNFRSAHPIIRKTRKPRQEPEYDRYGQAKDDGRLWIGTTKQTEKRALLILDTLFRKLEQHNFEIRSKNGKALLVRNNTELTLSISEPHKRFEYSSEEKKKNGGYRYYYEPTGVLSLVLERRWMGKSTWKDLPYNPIEHRLIDIVGETIEAYELDRIKTEEWNLKLQQQEDKRRLIEEERLRQIEEKRRLRELFRIARHRERASRILRLLKECESHLITDGLVRDSREAKFIRWGYNQLERSNIETETKLARLIDLIDRDNGGTMPPWSPGGSVPPISQNDR